MPKVLFHGAIQGFRGKIGNLIFRTGRHHGGERGAAEENSQTKETRQAQAQCKPEGA